MVKNGLGALASGLLCVFFASHAYAHTHVNLNIGIVSAPPAAPPAEVMMPPEGYSNCYVTEGVWMGDVWVPPHRECRYVESSGPAVWVAGYWGCLAIERDGYCGRWKWFHHRWMRDEYHHGYGHGYHHHHHHDW